MNRMFSIALATAGIVASSFGAHAEDSGALPYSAMKSHGPEACHAEAKRPVYNRATSFTSARESSLPPRAKLVSDLSDEEFRRLQAEFDARMPGAPSLLSSSTADAPQYEERSATNVFPYSKDATGLGPNGGLALYHVGVGVVGADLITHPETVGLPPTLEYNIPHLPQEEPLWLSLIHISEPTRPY